VEEDDIMAQVIGGAPSLISNLINLIKTPSLAARRCFLRSATRQKAFSKIQSIQMSVIYTDDIPREAAAVAGNRKINPAIP